MNETKEIYFDADRNIKHEPEEIIVHHLESLEESPDESPIESLEDDTLPIQEKERKYGSKSSLKSFICEFCGKGYCSPYSLKRHENSICYSNTSSFKIKEYCEACKKSVSCLDSHEALYHSNNFYKCNLCSFGTKYAHNLISHKNSIHFKRSKYECAVCKKKFKDQSNRNRHERLLHRTEVKIFSCFICPQLVTFSRNDNLTLHLKRIHGIEAHSLKKYPSVMHCDLCESTYATKICLIKHMKLVHTTTTRPEKHKCNICGLEFASRYTLVNHLNGIHLKKYCCQFCCKIFSSEKTLKSHELRGKC